MRRAILLVDHGSRLPEANAILERVAELVRLRLPEWSVGVAHMELARPDIGEGLDRLVDEGATEIVVHPYFLAPGNHSTSDIPRLVREQAGRHPGVVVRVSGPLGVHPGLVDAVVDRIREADG